MVSHEQYVFFIPPEFGPADEPGSRFYTPSLRLLLFPHILILFYGPSYSSRLKPAAKSVANIFSRLWSPSLNHQLVMGGVKHFQSLATVISKKKKCVALLIQHLVFPLHCAWWHLHCNLTNFLAWWKYLETCLFCVVHDYTTGMLLLCIIHEACRYLKYHTGFTPFLSFNPKFCTILHGEIKWNRRSKAVNPWRQAVESSNVLFCFNYFPEGLHLSLLGVSEPLCSLLCLYAGGNPSRPGGFPGANSPGPVADLYAPSSQDSAVGNYISAASPQPGSGFGPSITVSNPAHVPSCLNRAWPQTRVRIASLKSDTDPALCYFHPLLSIIGCSTQATHL